MDQRDQIQTPYPAMKLSGRPWASPNRSAQPFSQGLSEAIGSSWGRSINTALPPWRRGRIKKILLALWTSW